MLEAQVLIEKVKKLMNTCIIAAKTSVSPLLQLIEHAKLSITMVPTLPAFLLQAMIWQLLQRRIFYGAAVYNPTTMLQRTERMLVLN